MATLSDSQKPSTILVSRVSASYQRSEKPVKTASCRVLLNENTIMKNSGRYKNRKISRQPELAKVLFQETASCRWPQALDSAASPV